VNELLHKFEDDAKADSDDPNKPPNCILAKDLDGNFAICFPRTLDGNNATYTVKAQKDGWELLPNVEFDVCENGQAVRYAFFATAVATQVE